MALPPPDPVPKKKKPSPRRKTYARFVDQTPSAMKKYNKRQDRIPKYQAAPGYRDAPGGTKYRGQISYDNAHNTRKV